MTAYPAHSYHAGEFWKLKDLTRKSSKNDFLFFLFLIIMARSGKKLGRTWSMFYMLSLVQPYLRADFCSYLRRNGFS